MLSTRRPARVRPPRLPAPRHRARASFTVSALLLAGACASAPRVVPPAELPALEARVAEAPDDEGLRRLLAVSLVAADRCQEAVATAEGVSADADRAWPLLVRGRCLERSGRVGPAVSLYEEYLDSFPGAAGATPVRGQLLLARERMAVLRVRGADAGTLPDPPDSVVAVLPLEVVGPERFRPLGRGLAAQITSDLLLLDRVRLVERAGIQAILDELALARSPLVDSTTAPSFGRVVQAGRLVDGTVEVPADERLGMRGAVVLGDGRVVPTDRLEGSLEELLDLQKELVFAIADRLGHPVSAAERARILENGTRSLRAFLVWAEGLELADRGDYAAAAARFAEAYRIDGGFTGAREMLDASVGAHELRDRGPAALALPTGEMAGRAREVLAGGDLQGPDPVDGAVTSSLNDVAPTQGEQAMGGVAPEAPGGTSTEAVGTIDQPSTPPAVRPGVVRIRVTIPGGGEDR